MVVFLEAFEGKGKKTEKLFQCVKLMEIRKSKRNGEIQHKVANYFFNVDSKIDCSALKCGAVVKAEIENDSELSDEPVLVSLTDTGENAFETILELSSK